MFSKEDEMNERAITRTQLSPPLFNRGKARDIYELPANRLLMVTTDRVSAFDVVMNEGIPGKGKVLNQLSVFWFHFLRDKGFKGIKDHFITDDLNSLSSLIDKSEIKTNDLIGRSMIVRRHNVIPIECVVRGYITGSGWKSYKETGQVCDIELPRGLKESEQLPESIFTPATKAATGHDENISFVKMIDMLNSWLIKSMPTCPVTGTQIAYGLRAKSRGLYDLARRYAEQKGIIIADTKFEFGLTKDGKTILIDEVLTPDSSRFWPSKGYQSGRSQPSFDKQYVRDYLLTTGWDKNSPPPPLPAEIIKNTTLKYQEALKRLAA